ncbi:MAG: carboxypeptidase-like regulatory domain-containing protein [Bacteroidota bacterium]
MKVKTCLLVCLLALPFFGYTQAQSGIYQLSGLIISQADNEPIPYVTVQVNHSRRGTISNEEGFYSIPVTEYDTVFFTHVGFKRLAFPVREYLKNYPNRNPVYLYAIHYMRRDTFTLPTINIFPYDTPEELRTAIVNMDPTGTPEAIARENMNPEVIDAIIQTLPVDGDERLQIGRQMYYDYFQQRNLIPTVGLDPLAAMRLLQYVADKSEKRKNKDLHYWE